MEKISQAQKQREAAQKAALASAKKAERAALLNQHHAHRKPPPPQQNGGAAHNPYAGIVGSRISFPSSSWGTTTVASPASASTSQNYQQTSISNSLMTPAMNSTQTSFTKSTLPSNHMLLSVQQFLESQKKGPQQSSWNNNKKILSSNLAAALSINQVVHIFLTDQKRFQEIFQNTVKALGQDSSSAREVNPTNTCPPPSQTTQPPQDLLRSLMGSNSHATQARTTPEGILAMLQRMQSWRNRDGVGNRSSSWWLNRNTNLNVDSCSFCCYDSGPTADTVSYCRALNFRFLFREATHSLDSYLIFLNKKKNSMNHSMKMIKSPCRLQRISNREQTWGPCCLLQSASYGSLRSG